ncbi:MAG: hypothetical protein PHT99_02155 [Methanoregula sp.]|nr:hypothetical protein [Methanoregula sp.]
MVTTIAQGHANMIFAVLSFNICLIQGFQTVQGYPADALAFRKNLTGEQEIMTHFSGYYTKNTSICSQIRIFPCYSKSSPINPFSDFYYYGVNKSIYWRFSRAEKPYGCSKAYYCYTALPGAKAARTKIPREPETMDDSAREKITGTVIDPRLPALLRYQRPAEHSSRRS